MCIVLNYVLNLIVGVIFLLMVGVYGLSGLYGFYILLCVSGYVFVDRFIFETKGLCLEDVELMLKRYVCKRLMLCLKFIDE